MSFAICKIQSLIGKKFILKPKSIQSNSQQLKLDIEMFLESNSFYFILNLNNYTIKEKKSSSHLPEKIIIDIFNEDKTFEVYKKFVKLEIYPQSFFSQIIISLNKNEEMNQIKKMYNV